MQNTQNSAPQGAGARGTKAPVLRLENGYVAIGYDFKSRSHYEPRGLIGYEDKVEELFELVNYIMGIDDIIHAITIVGETPEGEKYQVTIKFQP